MYRRFLDTYSSIVESYQKAACG